MSMSDEQVVLVPRELTQNERMRSKIRTLENEVSSKQVHIETLEAKMDILRGQLRGDTDANVDHVFEAMSQEVAGLKTQANLYQIQLSAMQKERDRYKQLYQNARVKLRQNTRAKK